MIRCDTWRRNQKKLRPGKKKCRTFFSKKKFDDGAWLFFPHRFFIGDERWVANMVHFLHTRKSWAIEKKKKFIVKDGLKNSHWFCSHLNKQWYCWNEVLLILIFNFKLDIYKSWPAEAIHHDHCQQKHCDQCFLICPLGLQLRHTLKVHSPNSREQCQRHKYGRKNC